MISVDLLSTPVANFHGNQLKYVKVNAGINFVNFEIGVFPVISIVPQKGSHCLTSKNVH